MPPEPEPDPVPAAPTPEPGMIQERMPALSALPTPEPGSDAVPREVYRELLARHEAASYRIGYLEAQLAPLPALTEGAAAAASRAAELEARAKDAERELLRAASLHASEQRRGRRWAVGALVLAVLAAVLIALLAIRAG